MPESAPDVLTKALVAVLVTACAFPAAGAAAAPGDRDWLVGAGLAKHLSNGTEQGAVAGGIVRQPDGKVVVAGTLRSDPARDRTPSVTRLVLARFTSAGRLDANFGSRGIVITDVSGGNEAATALMRQSNGRLVVAGRSRGRMLLVRYLSSGRLDRSFGSGGVLVYSPGPGSDSVNAVRARSAGRILVAGQTGTRGALVQYRSDGRLDPSFGVRGQQLLSLGPRTGRLSGLAVDHHGRILASGTNGETAVVVRLSGVGKVDRAYGDGGYARVSEATGHALVLDSAQRVLLAGGNLRGGTRDSAGRLRDNGLMIARLSTGGSPDGGFGAAGVSRIPRSQGTLRLAADAGSLALDGSGRPLVTGVSSASATCAFLGRLTTTGELDPAFRPGGTEPEPGAPCASASQVFDVSAPGPDGGRSEYVGVAVAGSAIFTAGAMGGDEFEGNGPELVLARFRG